MRRTITFTGNQAFKPLTVDGLGSASKISDVISPDSLNDIDSILLKSRSEGFMVGDIFVEKNIELPLQKVVGDCEVETNIVKREDIGFSLDFEDKRVTRLVEKSFRIAYCFLFIMIVFLLAHFYFVLVLQTYVKNGFKILLFLFVLLGCFFYILKLLSKSRVRIVQLSKCDSFEGDLRPDSHSLLGLKHNSPMDVWMQVSDLFGKHPRIRVSLEMISQLTVANLINPNLPYDVAVERIFNAATRLQTVSSDRHIILDNEHDNVYLNSAAVALGIYCANVEKFSKQLNFVSAPESSIGVEGFLLMVIVLAKLFLSNVRKSIQLLKLSRLDLMNL